MVVIIEYCVAGNFSAKIIAAFASDGPFVIEGPEVVSLGPQAAHEFVIRYTPRAVELNRLGLFIRDAYGKTYRIPLLGCGGQSDIVLESAASLDFGTVAVGGTSATHTITLWNTGVRSGFVHLDSTDAKGQLAIAGRSAVLAPGQAHSFTLAVAVADAPTLPLTSVARQISLLLSCGDELLRLRRRRCLHARWQRELADGRQQVSAKCL